MSGKWLLGITVCLCAAAQPRFGTGHSIGTVSTEGNLIVMTLNEGALGRANLFDLAGRTVRFTRKGSGYTIENRPLAWDPEFGSELSGPQVTLRRPRPRSRAERTKVTIEDVIAAEGPRLPDVAHAQKKFYTGIVVVMEHGAKPSRELIERANGIRERWMDYWETVTGHRASMTATPR